MRDTLTSAKRDREVSVGMRRGPRAGLVLRGVLIAAAVGLAAFLAPSVAFADWLPHTPSQMVASWYIYVPAVLAAAAAAIGGLVGLRYLARQSAEIEAGASSVHADRSGFTS